MVAASVWYVTCFYRFIHIEADKLSTLQAEMHEFMTKNGVLGLVLFAEEGINGTVAGDQPAIEKFKQYVWSLMNATDITFKDSTSEKPPFHRVRVQLRAEIVGLKRRDLVPETTQDHHLTPKQWHDAMASSEPKLVIDTRNKYETMVGKFKGAIDPEIQNFSQWGEYLEKTEIPEGVPVYIYCTGGIRCEKAILEMRTRGHENVYQLRDGILGYLAEYPEGYYEGECFVFDERVAVDHNLKPSTRFGICPGCGLTAETKNVCDRCDAEYFVCATCDPTWGPVCSKACRDLWQRHGPKKA